MKIDFEPGAMEAGDGADAEGLSKESVLLVVPLVSIAISLKRIADVVAGKSDGSTMDLTNGIMHAIEQGILSASNRG